MRFDEVTNSYVLYSTSCSNFKNQNCEILIIHDLGIIPFLYTCFCKSTSCSNCRIWNCEILKMMFIHDGGALHYIYHTLLFWKYEILKMMFNSWLRQHYTGSLLYTHIVDVYVQVVLIVGNETVKYWKWCSFHDWGCIHTLLMCMYKLF